jgi:hypothetical protein
MSIEIITPQTICRDTATMTFHKDGVICLSRMAVQKTGIKKGDEITLGRDANGLYLVTGKDAKGTRKCRISACNAIINSVYLANLVINWYAEEHNLINSDKPRLLTLTLLDKEAAPGIYGLVNPVVAVGREYKRKK